MNPEYNISEIFSTAKRDYLIRSDGVQVKVDSLRGKFVGIFFVQFHRLCDWEEEFNRTIDAYDELSRTKGDFEIVFVPVVPEFYRRDREDLFNLCLSRMPWLTVPLSDIESRSHLTELFIGIGDFYLDGTGSYCPILDPNGRLLKHPYFVKYGGDCYHFTSEWMIEVMDEDFNAQRMMYHELSVQAVLASPDCDYLISNHGEMIPVSALEGKLVGLFFYGGSFGVSLLPKLIQVYNKLKEKGIANFEIVFINLHFLDYGFRNEKTFNEEFGKMPWLSLPYKDKRCRRLFQYFIEDKCHIKDIEAGYTDDWYVDQVDSTMLFIRKPLDLFGTRVLMEFGAEGYPFTKDRGVELVKERLKAQTLESLLRSAHHNFLIKNDGCIIPISQLRGKKVMLFLASRCNYYLSEEWLPDLIKSYEKLKIIDDSFEIIYLSIGSNGAYRYFNSLFCKMPWLAIPFDAGRLYRLLTDVFGSLSGHLTFGSDGRLLTTEICVPLQTDEAEAEARAEGDDWPFTDRNLLREAERILTTRDRSYTDEDDETGRRWG